MYSLFMKVSCVGREPFLNAVLQLTFAVKLRTGKKSLQVREKKKVLGITSTMCGGSTSDDKLKESIEKWLTSQAANFYEWGIQSLVPHYDKCFGVGGDMLKSRVRYVEFW